MLQQLVFPRACCALPAYRYDSAERVGVGASSNSNRQSRSRPPRCRRRRARLGPAPAWLWSLDDRSGGGQPTKVSYIHNEVVNADWAHIGGLDFGELASAAAHGVGARGGSRLGTSTKMRRSAARVRVEAGRERV